MRFLSVSRPTWIGENSALSSGIVLPPGDSGQLGCCYATTARCARLLTWIASANILLDDQAMTTISDWSKVTRPIPVPNEWTKPFWESAKRGVLALQRCQACKHFQHPPYATCVRCMAIDLAFEPVSGKGAIYAYTIMYHAGDRRFAAAIPYASIIVELDDAPGALL